jgi:glycerol-3-phosphate dehydrogenase
LEREVTEITKTTRRFSITAGGDTIACGILINAAGLFADRISAMAATAATPSTPAGANTTFWTRFRTACCNGRSIPFRARRGGLGVHLTPTMDGNLF